jgi:hypothetical protein
MGEQRIMEELGLDGHWLMATVLDEIPKQRVDLDAPRVLFHQQIAQLMLALDEELYATIQNGYVAEGHDDDTLTRMDAWLEEHMPEILAASEKILVEVYNILGNYSSPPHCQSKTVDKYLLGYSMCGNHAGCLHFEFTDYENHRSL